MKTGGNKTRFAYVSPTATRLQPHRAAQLQIRHWRNETRFVRRRAGRLAYKKRNTKMAGILWAIITVLFILWLVGFAVFHLGAIVHLLLVIAVVMVIYNVITKGKVAL